MPIDRILLLEPDDANRRELNALLKQLPCKVDQADQVEAAEALMHHAAFDWILVSDQVPPESLPDLLGHPTKGEPPPPVLYLAATEDSAMKGLQQGATDYLTPPYSAARLELALTKAEMTARGHRILMANQDPNASRDAARFLGQSIPGPEQESFRASLKAVAQTDAPVLIVGPTGTGKAAAARVIHQESSRQSRPFLVLDAATAESPGIDLFGAEQYDANGEYVRREGLLELADGGSLLIRDIPLLPMEIQGKLAEFLKDQSFERMGGKERVQARPRIMATASQSIPEAIEAGTFREDLYLTLNLLPVEVPSLKECPAELAAQAERFRRIFSQVTGNGALAISSDGMESLQAHNWPGNLLELEGIIARGVASCGDGGVIHATDLFPPLPKPSSDSGPSIESLAIIEKKHIFDVLGQCNDNRTHAARHLGISIRTLRNKLREYREQDKE